MKWLATLLVLFMALVASDGWAKRLAGGASVGKQSSQVDRTVSPNTGASSTGTTSSAASAATAQAKKPWGAILGGLAAGLGLAWLASSLGLGDGVATFLVTLLFVGVVVGIVVWLVHRHRTASSKSASGRHDLAYQGASATPRSYSPQNVGNDASARPWERSTTNFESSRYSDIIKPNTNDSIIGAGLAASTTSWGIPANFDVEGFLQASKSNFINLQAAWDKADVPSLRAMMTDEMLSQIKSQLLDRERQQLGTTNVTDVVMLEARLLGIEDLEHEYMASVEFSGLIREDVSAGPSPFREVWNITRPKSGQAGWLVAGVQALQ